MPNECWVTINGVHVLIGAKGTISKGPANLVGKTVEEIKGKENTSTQDTDSPTTSRGVNGKNLLPNYDNMSDDEALIELEKRGIDSTEAAIKAQGFNGLPTVMNSKDFDKFIEDGGIELARGISASDKSQAEQYVNDLKYGDFYVAGGEAHFGCGMYAFGGDSLTNATRYAQGNSGTVVHMALPKDAKILEVNGEFGLRSPETIKALYDVVDSFNYHVPVKSLQYKDNKLAEYAGFLNNTWSNEHVEFLQKQGYKFEEPDVSLAGKDLAKYLKMDNMYNLSVRSASLDYLRKTLSKEDIKILINDCNGGKCSNTVTASRGYDAIKLSPEYVKTNSSNGPTEIWIVLNRSKLVVKE